MNAASCCIGPTHDEARRVSPPVASRIGYVAIRPERTQALENRAGGPHVYRGGRESSLHDRTPIHPTPTAMNTGPEIEDAQRQGPDADRQCGPPPGEGGRSDRVMHVREAWRRGNRLTKIEGETPTKPSWCGQEDSNLHPLQD
jgi:hypothetical protein